MAGKKHSINATISISTKRRNFYTIFLICFSYYMLAPFSQPFGWGITCSVEWPKLLSAKGLSLHDFHTGVFITRHSGTPRPLWFPWLSHQLFSSLVKFHWHQNVLSSSSWSRGSHTDQLVMIVAKSILILLFSAGGRLFSSFRIHSSVPGFLLKTTSIRSHYGPFCCSSHLGRLWHSVFRFWHVGDELCHSGENPHLSRDILFLALPQSGLVHIRVPWLVSVGGQLS